MPAPFGPEQAEDLALLDREVDPADRLEVPVGLAQAADLDRRHRRRRVDGTRRYSRRVAGSFRFVVADVFTDVPLAGNQLAVFTDAREIPEERLQPLAREINFSETVFVYPASGDGHARIRIFTPALELPFAGHPVLGTAFVLAGPLQLEELWLETGAGVVPVRLERDGSRIVFGWMRQPPVSAEPFEQADELLALLGVEQSGLPVELYRQGPRHVYVELDSPEAVAALRPDFGRAAGAESLRHLLLRARRRELEGACLRPGPRRRRGSGDRLGRGAARAPSRPARPDRLRRRDRDPPGRRARAAVDALRAVARSRRRSRSAARPSSWRAASSASDLLDALVQSIQPTESMSGSSNGSELQKTPPLAET